MARTNEPMKAVVVAAGTMHPGDERELADAALVVAADGGANALAAIGRPPDLVVGDLDSVDPQLVSDLERASTPIRRWPVDKDASDTELALRAAVDEGATEIAIVAATGADRLDHELANVLLLTDPDLATRDVRLVRGRETVRVARPGAALRLRGRPGDLVTLLAIGGDAIGVTTEGLRWPLHGARLAMGTTLGVSNVVIGDGSVSVEEGMVLVIERSSQGAA